MALNLFNSSIACMLDAVSIIVITLEIYADSDYSEVSQLVPVDKNILPITIWILCTCDLAFGYRKRTIIDVWNVHKSPDISLSPTGATISTI